MKALFLDDEQCALVREMLDYVPLTPRYLPLVVDLLQRIPESAAGPDTSADSAPPTPVDPSRGIGGGFRLTALTAKGAAKLAHLEHVLGQLEVLS